MALTVVAFQGRSKITREAQASRDIGLSANDVARSLENIAVAQCAVHQIVLDTVGLGKSHPALTRRLEIPKRESGSAFLG